MFLEEFVRCAEVFREQAPQTFAADFAAMTIEAKHRSFRMFFFRPVDRCPNAQPAAHGRDLAKWNSGLCHAERPGIHSEEQDAFPAVSETFQINLVRLPCVFEWVVNVRDRRSELQPGHASSETSRCRDQLIARAHALTLR